ncbi:MAG: hypothetical protein ACHBN1_34915 [Heteroscytonema crispum UTEX LB 1556]
MAQSSSLLIIKIKTSWVSQLAEILVINSLQVSQILSISYADGRWSKGRWQMADGQACLIYQLLISG